LAGVEQDPFILNMVTAGVAHCRTVAVEHGGLLASLTVAGLIGGVTHCAGMCGPFVLGQTMARLEKVPAANMREIHRLAGAALVPYHLGRATTYAALGAVAAALAGGVIDVTGFRWLSAALLLLAAAFFLAYALHRVGILGSGVGAPGTETGLAAKIMGRTVRPLLDRPFGWRSYALGVALGFLPCGLLYGALAGAAASGDALAGALGMIAFTLGTVPALVAVGLAGHVVGARWRVAAMRTLPALMLVNAAALSYLAWRMIA
jgi:sulfite exporter TauE/SafE